MSTPAITGSAPTVVQPPRFEIAQATLPEASVTLSRSGRNFGTAEQHRDGIYFRPSSDLPSRLAGLKQTEGFHLKLKLPAAADVSSIPSWKPGEGAIPDGTLYRDARTQKVSFYVGPATMARAGNSLDAIRLNLPAGTKVFNAVTW